DYITGLGGEGYGSPGWARLDALPPAQARQEPRQLGVGQRRMVFDPPPLGARRQQLIEVPAPTGRVLARAIAARLCPVQDRLDAAAHPARGLGLGCPDWF